ncbi:hypothetical protein [Intrasporangium sp. YIM S08009]|uniref:hypothetical protein n=1 Tax=Intrasporangium zincisolvens TaxID=3080018 RepID=UPI002B058ED9|nr:hypothetical protein [Intrasporangium sp. YIM S08009]
MPNSRLITASLAAAVLVGGPLTLWAIRDDDVTWHSGTAVIARDPATAMFFVPNRSVEDAVTYGAQGAVARWVDGNGNVQSGGWPTCLARPAEPNLADPQEMPVRFGTVDVDEDLGGGPMVVVVDCRG